LTPEREDAGLFPGCANFSVFHNRTLLQQHARISIGAAFSVISIKKPADLHLPLAVISSAASTHSLAAAMFNLFEVWDLGTDGNETNGARL
jgi:hypothetical protein